MSRLIDADKLCEYARNQVSRSVDANDIMRFPRVNAEPKWIPVSERLPEENGVYLTTMCDRNRIYLCRYDKGGRGNESYWKYSIKAWMPLPEPYKGEQDE